MYRAITSSGEITCATYEMVDDGVELYNDDEELIAYIPDSGLEVLLNEDVYTDEDEDERAMQ